MRQLLNTLYVSIPSAYLSTEGENIVVLDNEKELLRVPLHNLEGVVSIGYKGVSPALMRKCSDYGIGLSFVSPSGRFLARVEGDTRGNVLLRRQQFRLADDPMASLSPSKNMIGAKVHNANLVLKRVIRDHASQIDVDKVLKAIKSLSDMLSLIRDIDTSNTLRGIEGVGAETYFSVFDEMILVRKDFFTFAGRNKRPPTDPVNAMLSFAYTLATNECASALETVGLDPYVGFLHTDRPGRMSLACDLVEEFRAPVCDRFVLSLINNRRIAPDDFLIKENGAVLMSDDARRSFLKAWQEQKTEIIKHPFLGEKVKRGLLPYIQATLLARYIRGDLSEYPPFLWPQK